MLSLVALPLLGTGVAGAQSMPRMMTDGPEYCHHLNNEMLKLQNRLAIAPLELQHLADVGARMCDRGQYRGGIARLRRVLVEMRRGY